MVLYRNGLLAFCLRGILLQETDPEVASYLEKAMGVSALEIAFPMMFSAFVGFLSPSETLLLWDRIIGFDSLLPLPVLAVAVMVFRWAPATIWQLQKFVWHLQAGDACR